jgi:TetR/AcrR family acrAB operon transcriptional repressor
MRRTKEEAEQTRRQLMDAGLKVFGERGYEAARLSDIAAEAGVTRGAVHWHFKNKQGLLFAILREMANPYVETATEVLNSNLAAGEKIRQLICRVLDASDESEAFLAHRRLATRFMAESPEGFEEYHRHVSRDMKKLVRKTVNVIREGQRAGDLRPDIDASVITGVIGAIFRGTAMMKMIKGIDILPRGSSAAVVDMIMKGLEPK